MVALVPYTHDDLLAYQQFARAQWGNTYQATEKYLQWLYKEIPTNIKPLDFTLAKDGEQIIGVIHKMRLPWMVHGQRVDIPAIHNLIVDPKHRTGNGLFLIMASLKGDEHIFVPGVLPPLLEAYEALRSQYIPLAWYRKILKPLSLGLSLLTKKAPAMPQLPKTPPSLIEAMANTYHQRVDLAAAHIAWDTEWLTWRFFHPHGPQHIAIHEPSETGLNFLIFSIGVRKNILIARLIEGSVDTAQAATRLYEQALPKLKKHGVQLLLGHIGDETIIKGIPLKPRPIKAKTYIYHKDRKPFLSYRCNGAAGDFGFEGIGV